MAWPRILLCVGTLVTVAAGPPPASSPNHSPVKVIASDRLRIGNAELPLFLSRDWSKPLPGIRRAVIILHGYLRNADVYFRTGLRARTAAGPAGSESLIIAPQFLAGIDIVAWHLSPETLRWSLTGWEAGEPAEDPVPISSFDALDAILLRLSDRTLFPDLTVIVIAGHSGGAQVVQRYAVLSRGEEQARAGVQVRFVVANPSSYAWFGPNRPQQAIANACPGYDRWKYGMEGLPPYAAGMPVARLEQRYAGRDVVYLSGTDDTDPNSVSLDRTCMAEAQGSNRLVRSQAYFSSLHQQYGSTLRQQRYEVRGVGHDNRAMLTSPCGLAALFYVAGCP